MISLLILRSNDNIVSNNEHDMANNEYLNTWNENTPGRCNGFRSHFE